MTAGRDCLLSRNTLHLCPLTCTHLCCIAELRKSNPAEHPEHYQIGWTRSIWNRSLLAASNFLNPPTVSGHRFRYLFCTQFQPMKRVSAFSCCQAAPVSGHAFSHFRFNTWRLHSMVIYALLLDLRVCSSFALNLNTSAILNTNTKGARQQTSANAAAATDGCNWVTVRRWKFISHINFVRQQALIARQKETPPLQQLHTDIFNDTWVIMRLEVHWWYW